MSQKKPKIKKIAPGVSGRKKRKKRREFSNTAMEFVDSDYIDQLSTEKNIELPSGEMISEKEYHRRFMREFYANNHSSEDSLHKQILGDKYDKEIVGQNQYGKDITLKQEMFQHYNARFGDALGRATWGEMVEGIVNEEWGEEKYGFIQEDMSTVKNLLKHYTYKEVIDLHVNDALAELQNLWGEITEEEELILRNLVYHVTLLAMKIRKDKKRLGKK